MRSTALFVLIIALLPVFRLSAQKTEWTPEDIIHTQYVYGPAFSPDARMVVWRQRKGLKEKDKFVNDLYLARLDLTQEDKIRTFQLTSNKESDNSPLFSRDNEFLYFLSSRDKGKKLWRLSLFGGEAEEVHEFKNGISNIRWLKEDVLIYSSTEGKTLYEIENEKDNTQIVEDTAHWKPRRLYSFDVKKKKIERITNNSYRVGSYAVSRDGKHLVYQLILSPDYGVDGNPKPKYYLKNLESGAEKKILAGLQTPYSMQFTASSRGFYFLAVKSSNPEWNGAGISGLYYFDLTTGNYQKVPLAWSKGVANYYISGEDVLAQMANGPLHKVLLYQKNGSTWQKRELDFGGEKNEHVAILNTDRAGGKVLYTYSTASSLPEYYVADLKKGKKGVQVLNARVLCALNNSLKKKTTAKSEIIYWKGAKEEEVNGILYYPKDFEPDKKYPLILSIHGGPTGVDRDSWSERWSTYPQIYTDKGAFVLKPNYHGSGQHELEFIESIKNGNYYHLEQVDLYNGIQHLKDKGWIDMDKLGIMGWSNGAILTTWMTLKYPDMFKAAAPGAGDINWTSDYGTCSFGVTFDQSYFGGAPWDDTNGKHYNEWYINNSPIFEIEKIRTPTIIFHGSEDRAVPRDQGWEYYRGLQQVGKAPVKFLWFPGQPHGLQKITHQLRKMKEEIKWFDRYLFDKADNPNEAFKKDSPLAAQLLVQKNRNAQGYYGKTVDGKLIPETVPLGEDTIGIGRFEVTMAQYYASRGEAVPGNNGNEPARGLNQEDIANYLSWLNNATGKTYRLPNADEAAGLNKLSRKSFKGQNNLNHWAGYDITAFDVQDLKTKMSELDGSLIKNVGSHLPVTSGKAKLFDIGGNVAEYYQDGEALKVYGYSAYDFVDLHEEKNATDKSNIGFRVVLEK